MKITQRMKNELKAHGYVDTRNYRYELDRHYDGFAYLSRIPMESVRRQTTDLIDGWEVIMDVDLINNKWETPCLKWKVIHECDDENGNPTQWATEINHLRYGKYCWISYTGDYFSVEVNCDGFVELAKCHSLAGAKLWIFRLVRKERCINA